jgi:hypothetical protein
MTPNPGRTFAGALIGGPWVSVMLVVTEFGVIYQQANSKGRH